MFFRKSSPLSLQKQQVIANFRQHISSGKVAFFEKYGMDFVMGRREGVYLWDMDGQKRLFNLHCNGGVFNLGHRNAEVRAILQEALENYDIGNHHLMSGARAELAAALAAHLPGDLEYTVFGVSGGEAVDLAIKVARAFTGRGKIVSAQGGYHGHTGLALAAGDEKYRAPFGPTPPGFVQIPFGKTDALSAVDGDTAAILLETVPATLGVVVPEPAYLKAVRRRCDDTGALLILDEVQTGLGRTGRLWAFEHFAILPDMVVLGKGLSGGWYPITATVLRHPLEAVFHADPFIHISTFGGAEPGCVVAKKVLEMTADAAFLAHVNELAGRFAAEVEKLRKKYPQFLLELRQLGLMMGLKLRDPWCGPLLTKTAYEQGLLLIYANNDPSVCQLLPPLVMPPEQVDEVMPRLDAAIASAQKLRPFITFKEKVGRFFDGK